MVWPRGGVRVYAAGNDGLQVTLADDSRVEMRAHAEMTVDRASDGIQIDLKKGDIIVTAAKQRGGQLSVQTKDFTVAVEGTVFLADAGEQGSRVGVIDGEVRVRERGTPPPPISVETRLGPGEQVATSLTVSQRSLADDITWSRNADAHRAILESFRRGMAQTSSPLSPVVPAGERQQGASPAAPAALEFEEASIRLCDPNNIPPPPAGARGGGANSFYMTPGRTYVLCMTPATLIRTAYGLGAAGNEFINDGSRARPVRLNMVAGLGVENGTMVRGGPDWVRTERYTIEAVADPAADVTTMSRTMMRGLLERRFQLRAHLETEQIPAFALTVAEGGLKMKPTPDGGCEAPAVVPDQPLPPARSFADVRRGEKPTCGLFAQSNGPNVVWVGGGVTIGGEGLTGLAKSVALRLGRVRVIDKTGLTGAYTFVLEYAPDAATEPSGIPRGADLATALEEQLGLKVEPTLAPREFVVIDAVERPSAN
jgi:uncharacterized protein (TIGR03435 family)